MHPKAKGLGQRGESRVWVTGDPGVNWHRDGRVCRSAMVSLRASDGSEKRRGTGLKASGELAGAGAESRRNDSGDDPAG